MLKNKINKFFAISVDTSVSKAMIKKEFLLILRNRAALFLLFIFPSIMIVTLSSLTKDVYKEKNMKFSLYIKDKDKTAISKNLLKLVDDDKSFKLLKNSKDAEFVLEIPDQYSRDTSLKLNLKIIDSINSEQVEIFKTMLSAHIISARFKTMAHSIKQFSRKAAKKILSVDVSVDAFYAVSFDKAKNIPTSTQHSVATWIVLSFFLIIVPMSSIYANELSMKILTRVDAMNISLYEMVSLRNIPYFVITQIQILIMIFVGFFLVPLFDAPSLDISGSILALIVLSFSLAIAAVGMSTFITVVTHSSGQAKMLGLVTISILGFLGGAIIPKFAMPEFIQSYMEFSPFSWAVDGFVSVFLKSANVLMIIDDAWKLALFGVLTYFLAMFIIKLHIKKGF